MDADLSSHAECDLCIRVETLTNVIFLNCSSTKISFTKQQHAIRNKVPFAFKCTVRIILKLYHFCFVFFLNYTLKLGHVIHLFKISNLLVTFLK